MKKTRTAFFLSFLFFIVFFKDGLLFAESVPGSSEGVFAVPSGCRDKNKNNKCVIGKLPVGTSVFLLGEKRSEICEAKIEKSFPAEFEVGDDFFLSKLNLGRCQNFHFNLAVVKSKPYSYKLIKPSDVRDEAVITKIDRAIRQQRYSIESNGGIQHPWQLPEDNPKILKLPNQPAETFIVIYKNAAPSGDEIHMLYSSGKIKLIHGAATIKGFFSLNNRYFIHYKFTCQIGCGWRGEFIIEFSGKDFKMVMFDDSGST